MTRTPGFLTEDFADAQGADALSLVRRQTHVGSERFKRPPQHPEHYIFEICLTFAVQMGLNLINPSTQPIRLFHKNQLKRILGS